MFFIYFFYFLKEITNQKKKQTHYMVYIGKNDYGMWRWDDRQNGMMLK